MRIVAAVVCVWLAVLTGYALTPHGPSVGATSCAQVVHQYLHSTAAAVGVNLKHEHLIACHQDGNESVARVEFDATIESVGQTIHEVLALRLVKSPWGIADVHQVG